MQVLLGSHRKKQEQPHEATLAKTTKRAWASTGGGSLVEAVYGGVSMRKIDPHINADMQPGRCWRKHSFDFLQLPRRTSLNFPRPEPHNSCFDIH